MLAIPRNRGTRAGSVPRASGRATAGVRLDPYKARIDALLAKYPDLSAVHP